MDDLHTPKEPQEVKDWMENLEKRKGGSGIDWDSLNVWYGNQLSKYLWKEWKDKLISKGFNWQKFLRLLKYRTDKIILWHKGIIKWKELVDEFINLIEGPLGQILAKR